MQDTKRGNVVVNKSVYQHLYTKKPQILGLKHSCIILMSLRDLINKLSIQQLSTDSGGRRIEAEWQNAVL